MFTLYYIYLWNYNLKNYKIICLGPPIATLRKDCDDNLFPFFSSLMVLHIFSCEEEFQ